MNTFEQFADDHRRVSEQNRRENAKAVEARAQVETEYDFTTSYERMVAQNGRDIANAIREQALADARYRTAKQEAADRTYDHDKQVLRYLSQVADLADLGPAPRIDSDESYGEFWREVWQRVDAADRESGFGPRDRVSLGRLTGNFGN